MLAKYLNDRYNSRVYSSDGCTPPIRQILHSSWNFRMLPFGMNASVGASTKTLLIIHSSTWVSTSSILSQLKYESRTSRWKNANFKFIQSTFIKSKKLSFFNKHVWFIEESSNKSWHLISFRLVQPWPSWCLAPSSYGFCVPCAVCGSAFGVHRVHDVAGDVLARTSWQSPMCRRWERIRWICRRQSWFWNRTRTRHRVSLCTCQPISHGYLFCWPMTSQGEEHRRPFAFCIIDGLS